MAAVITAPDPNLSNEGVLAKLTEDVQAHGDGAYRATIRRRLGTSGEVSTLAIFERVTLQQCLDFEIWLSELIDGGSGHFMITLVREGQFAPVGGGFLQLRGQGTAPKPFNFSHLDRPDYRGPRDQANKRPEPVAPVPGAFQPLGTFDPPGAPSRVSPGQGVGAGGYQGGGASIGAPPPLGNDHASYERAIAAERQRFAEERHRMELEMVRAESNRKMDGLQANLAALQRMIEQQARTPAVIPPPPPPPREEWTAEKIAGALGVVVGAVTPLVSLFMQGRERADAERRQSEERMAALQAKAAEESRAALEKLSERNAEHVKAIAASSAQNMEASAKMTGMLSQQLLNVTAAMTEIRSSGTEPEAAWAIALREIAGPLGKVLAANALKGGTGPIPAAGQITQGAQAPLNGAPQQQGASVVDAIMQMIATRQPIQQVTEVVLGAIQQQDASLFMEIMNYGGDLEKMLADKLGIWVRDPTNDAYLRQLFPYCRDEGIRRGLFNAPPGTAPQQPAPQQQAQPKVVEAARVEAKPNTPPPPPVAAQPTNVSAPTDGADAP